MRRYKFDAGFDIFEEHPKGDLVDYDDALALIRAAFEAGEARGKGLCGRFRHLYVDVDAAQWIREHVTGEVPR